jgi:hypothetical protein
MADRSHLVLNFVVFRANHPFRPLLVQYFLNRYGAVLVFRSLGNRIKMMDRQLIACANPPLIGHINRARIDPVGHRSPADYFSPARRHPDQFLIFDTQVIRAAAIPLNPRQHTRNTRNKKQLLLAQKRSCYSPALLGFGSGQWFTRTRTSPSRRVNPMRSR